MNMEEITQLHSRLVALLDTDPARAVVEARGIDLLACTDGDRPHALLLRSGILVDGGGASADSVAVRDGIAGFEQLRDTHPDLDLGYNIANGHDLLGRFDPDLDIDWIEWMQRTAEDRWLARAGFQAVASDPASPPDDPTRALTNLGNALSKAYRWVEAYDVYLDALKYDPQNGMASGNAALALFTCHTRGLANEATLPLAAWYRNHALRNADRAREFGGQAAVRAFGGISELDSVAQKGPADHSNLRGLVRFAALERLALVPMIEALDPNSEKWDSLRIPIFSEPIEAGGTQPPPIFAMFNTVKQNYLAARQIAYQAIYDSPADAGHYVDTLDYALYGVRSGMLTGSYKAAVDVLDQVAVIVNDLLGRPLTPRNVTFRKFWFANGDRWRPEIANAARTEANGAYGALADLAMDTRKGGRLAGHMDRRHATTHRFVVLHDETMGLTMARENEAAEHCELGSFIDELIGVLRIARSALTYLAELIGRRESSRIGSSEVPPVPLLLPSHHHVRGED